MSRIPPTVRAHLDAITARFAQGFRPGPAGLRTVGREAEHPVVQADGSAAEVALLWDALQDLSAQAGEPLQVKREGELTVALLGRRWTFFSEVGRGTIEVLTGPRQDLWEIAADHEAAMQILLRAVHDRGWEVLGYGIQPKTPASGAFMTPKARYGVLLESLGDPWLWFTLTASDQVHASVCREEVVPLSDTINLLSPLTVALTANSPVYAGAVSGYMSAREGTMGEIHAREHRHGMTAQALGSMDALVEHLARQVFIMELRQHAAGDWRHHVYDRSFVEWLQTYGEDPAASGRQDAYTAFLLHEHYIWNSARPRSNHGTLEMRAACQQPWTEPGAKGGSHHMAAAALGVALVEAGAALAPWLAERLGPDAWSDMRAWHHAAIARGLAAEEPVPGLIAGVLGHCEEALAARGRGEEALLSPLWARLERRTNAAQRHQLAFQAGGVDALVQATRIRP